MSNITEIIKLPTLAENLDINAILTICGDGKLRDGNETSLVFRDYLIKAPLSQISKHLEALLSSSIPDGGLALQDIINELGRRLNFNVEFGRYRGRSGLNGFDGYWNHQDGDLIVEVKTTDAYRISTNTLLQYSEKVKKERNLETAPPILLVVGRIDTGEIEDQIRGSRADDKISIMGVDSLLALTKAVADLADGPATQSIRSILIPRDYTNLDVLAGIIANAILEAQQVILNQQENSESLSQYNLETVSPTEDLKSQILSEIELKEGKLERASKAQYRTSDGRRIYILTSKRYSRGDQQFWFAFQDAWAKMLKDHGGFIALGLEGKNYFLKIPDTKLLENVGYLNESAKGNTKYRHIGLREGSNSINLILPKKGDELELTVFKNSTGKV